MMLEYHPAVQDDFNEAIAYYEAEGGSHLADRFEREFRDCVSALLSAPTQFPYYLGSDRYRRVHLKSFPFVVVYREILGRVRVMILRHERRHPRYGTARR